MPNGALKSPSIIDNSAPVVQAKPVVQLTYWRCVTVSYPDQVLQSATVSRPVLPLVLTNDNAQTQSVV